MKWVIWVASFIGLYLGIFWLHIILKKDKIVSKIKHFPTISLVVPAHNEEEGLPKTIHSIANLDYPKNKIQVIIVDHGSKDDTWDVAKRLIKRYKDLNIKLVKKEHESSHTKAHAFNAGLAHATGEFAGCVDADTILLKECLKEIIPEFDSERIGAVISTIKVTKPTNLYEKIQHLEYIFSTFMRTLMSKIETLHVTPGALSLYRKKIFDKHGGFDEENITEDLEMAMRLQSLGYKVRIAVGSITYTKVPNTFKSLWNQRVRWFRGFIYNNVKYKKMFMNKEYGSMGTFQYPVNILTLGTIILLVVMMSYELIRRIISYVERFLIIKWEIIAFEFPSLKEVIFNLDINLVIPIVISFFIAFAIYHLAHKNLKEKWKYPFALALYISVYPLLRSMHWITAIYKESVRAKKKW